MDVGRYFRIYQASDSTWGYEPHWQVPRTLTGHRGFGSRKDASADALKYWRTASQTVRDHYQNLYAQSQG